MSGLGNAYAFALLGIAVFLGVFLLVIYRYHTNPFLVISIGLVAIVIGGIFIFAGPLWTKKPASKTPAIGPKTTVTPDPFTFVPGATETGVISRPIDGSAFTDENSCLTKSINTVWSGSTKKCECETGWIGTSCENRSYSSSYVTLTTSSKFTAVYGSIVGVTDLTVWTPAIGKVGCTNICDGMGNNCVGVLYSEDNCTPITNLTFIGPPIQNTDAGITSDTMYLNISRLNVIKMVGFYNVLFGNTLPPRYFIGNEVSGLSGQNYFTTNTQVRVLNFAINTDYSFAGIPDYIIVNSPGTLHISTTVLPLTITSASGTLVNITTPVFINRETFLIYFGQANSSITFYVRYNPF